jgi:hypothetical protein
MVTNFRKPAFAVTAAFVLCILATVDTSFAQTSLSREVTLPDPYSLSQVSNSPTDSTQVEATLSSPTSPTILEPGLLDLSKVASVNAHVMALVSLQAKQVELAKTATGAKLVAADLIQANYSSWNSSQVSCLTQLWNNESHWNFKAHNYRSGAHGIPQALPAVKMNVIALDWRTNPVTQIRWGLKYISSRYGTPCAALRKQHRSRGY